MRVNCLRCGGVLGVSAAWSGHFAGCPLRPFAVAGAQLPPYEGRDRLREAPVPSVLQPDPPVVAPVHGPWVQDRPGVEIVPGVRSYPLPIDPAVKENALRGLREQAFRRTLRRTLATWADDPSTTIVELAALVRDLGVPLREDDEQPYSLHPLPARPTPAAPATSRT